MKRHRSELRVIVTACWVAVGAFVAAGRVSAQPPSRALTLQPGIGLGSTGFGGLGLAVAGELGWGSALRFYSQWTDWEVIAGCGVADAPSECNTEAHLFEVGGRWSFAPENRFAPYLGVGGGLYHRGRPEGVPTTNSVLLSLGAGVDFPLGDPLTLRASLVHHEVFDRTLVDLYGGRVRVTGLLVGIAVVAR